MKNLSKELAKIIDYDDPNQSIKELLELEKKYPLNIEIKQFASLCFRKLDDNTNALNKLLEALEIQPLNHTVNFNLGQLHKQFKKYDHAINYFKNSVKFYPEFEQGINTLGDIFFNKRDFDQSISYYKRFVDLNKSKNNVFAMFRLGLCFFERANISKNIEDRKRAVEYFEMAYEIKPEEASIQRNLISIYNIYGMKEKAVHLSRKVEGVFEINTPKKEIKIRCS